MRKKLPVTVPSRCVRLATASLAIAMLVVPGLAGAQTTKKTHVSPNVAGTDYAFGHDTNKRGCRRSASVEYLDQIASQFGLTISKRLTSGAVLTGNGHQLGLLAGANLVDTITEDGPVLAHMNITTQSTGASQVWASGNKAFGGTTGNGIGVAVIDSGVIAVGDLKNRILYSKNFTTASSATDEHCGHGTQISSIIAGSGAGSVGAFGGTYTGMAPGAAIINLRVLGADGSGFISDVIEAVDWTIAHKDQYKIRIINLSLGRPTITDWQHDPLERAVERAVASGLFVVCSAGNNGMVQDPNNPTGPPIAVQGGIESPGGAPDAFTVGALNTHGTVFAQRRHDDDVQFTWTGGRSVAAGDVDYQAGRRCAG